eukprot:TRINITY_DN2635_c1_g2_i1.p1 TRINITY_DN2635_c1_g2~~TRINITY_DN2635_c1_g2_i1.p1  ORF type:complete len:106 (+),score=7.20 TRINITY_DN2635_c1_g2_i1:887-1204(+)
MPTQCETQESGDITYPSVFLPIAIPMSVTPVTIPVPSPSFTFLSCLSQLLHKPMRKALGKTKTQIRRRISEPSLLKQIHQFIGHNDSCLNGSLCGVLFFSSHRGW